MTIGRLGVCALLISSFASVASRAQSQFITWHTNYQEALQLAKQTKKPVFLEFRCEA